MPPVFNPAVYLAVSVSACQVAPLHTQNVFVLLPIWFEYTVPFVLQAPLGDPPPTIHVGTALLTAPDVTPNSELKEE